MPDAFKNAEATPSAAFSATFPVKPSVTITSASSVKSLSASTKPQQLMRFTCSIRSRPSFTKGLPFYAQILHLAHILEDVPQNT